MQSSRCVPVPVQSAYLAALTQNNARMQALTAAPELNKMYRALFFILTCGTFLSISQVEIIDIGLQSLKETATSQH